MVEDRLNRYLPVVFGVNLPLPYRGVFLSVQPASLQTPAGRAFLFSGPKRAVLSGFAAVRADLWDAGSNAPAANAAMTVEVAGSVWTGIADENGKVLVMFPFPLVDRVQLGSPPGLGQGPADSMTWPMKVRVRYAPPAQTFPLAATPLGWPWTTTPSLKSILDGQPPAKVIASGNPVIAVDELDVNLTFGKPLVLKSRIIDPAQDRSQLLISWGTSPP